MKKVVLFSFLLILLACTSSNEHQPTDHQAIFYKVTKVVDGDTFWIADGSPKGKKIRLIGIDAPESFNTGRTTIEFMGKEAGNYLRDMILNEKVRIELDVDPLDRYGRTLAYAYTEDDLFINAHMIEQGYAQVMTIPPNVKYASLFLQLQKEAREAERGLWAE
jgi:micrococcal nuclease